MPTIITMLGLGITIGVHSPQQGRCTTTPALSPLSLSTTAVTAADMLIKKQHK